MVAVGIGVTAVLVLYGVYMVVPDAPAADVPSSTIQPIGPSETMPVMNTDGTLHTIPLDKIRHGGVPKDGIPSIDRPIFVNADSANFLSDSDVVMGLEINGDVRAYPLIILVWHEIVNDEVGDIPVAVTYCPLCYTSQVFKRVIDGETVEFGTTGKLYQSNLLMYDRLTDTYWSQALGTAVKGPLSGQTLELVPFDVVQWGDWKMLHPETTVLSTDTGFVRSYGVDPYGSYYTDEQLAFPVDHNDPRMHPKDIIIGLSLGGTQKAYRQADIESAVVINDEIVNHPVLLVSLLEDNSRAFVRMVDGLVLNFEYDGDHIVDTTTGTRWNYDGLAVSGQLAGSELDRLPIEPGFWFEWAAFHPDTLVYGGS